MTSPVEPTVSVLLDADWASGSLVDDVRRGLGARPLSLPPKWLYDDEGSRLFDEITRLPEYYPTETERAILVRHARDVVAACDATTVVELGSGTSDKTRMLLDAFASAGRLERFVPVDVAEQTLREAADMLSRRYPGLAVQALVGDFTLHLAHLPARTETGSRMVAFLGSTIGNLYVEERRAFLGALADSLEPRNSLRVLNRELGADFDLGAFSYVPFWDGAMERMDLRLRSEAPQHVRIPGADLELDLALGEEIRVEISTKFRTHLIAEELTEAGFGVERVWDDGDGVPTGDFALTLARRR